MSAAAASGRTGGPLDHAEGEAPEAVSGARWLGRTLWFLAPPYLLLLLLVYLPASENELKGVGFAVVTLFVVARTIVGWLAPTPRRVFLHPHVAQWTVFYLVVGAFFTGLGVANDNPGAWFQALLYLMWPVLYMALVTQVDSEQVLRRALRIVVFGSIAVSITIIDLVLVEAGRLPESLRVPTSLGARTTVLEGYTRVSSVMLATLVFTVPFLIACVMSVGKEARFVSAPVAWAALVLGIVASVLGSRRAGLVTIALAPLVTVVLMARMRGSQRLRRGLANGAALLLVAGLLSPVLSFSTGWDARAQITHIEQGFLFSDGGREEEGALERAEQSMALLHGWSDSPIVGSGFGAVAPGDVRDAERPWQYEIQYLLLLFHTGALGAVLYSSGVLWVLWKLWRLIGSGTAVSAQAVPVTVGLVSFLLANASNPYLQAYGQLWTLFLPIAVVNYALKERLAELPSAR